MPRRRVHSSVVLLKKRQRGGSDELKRFTEADLLWERFSTLFIGRLTDGDKNYEFKCANNALDIDDRNACKTNKPEIKLRLDALTYTLTFFSTTNGKSLLEWKLNRGILTLNESNIKVIYPESSMPNKIIKLMQWAIESIDQYYRDKSKIVPLLKVVLINKHTEEKPMVDYLNDDLRARYKCSTETTCDISFGIASAKKVSPKPIASAMSPSTISPLVFQSPTTGRNASIDIMQAVKPAAMQSAKPGTAGSSRKYAAKPMQFAKPTETAVKRTLLQRLRNLFTKAPAKYKTSG
jgi:hypothetical protein